MISNALTRIVAICALIALSATTAGAWPHKRGQKARVRFLATSTLVRGTFGQNEDTYLAQVFTARGDESYLIRLVDAYPNEAPPLSVATLTSDSGAHLRIQRDPQCDRSYEEMPLRAAPGDLLALLPEKLTYRPPLDKTLDLPRLLPWYRTAR